MKKICSSCGETFEGVVCTNCGKAPDRTTIITVSKPMPEETAQSFSSVQPNTVRALEKSQKKALRAEAQVKRLERAEERRSRRNAKRENRLVQSEQSSSTPSKTLTQLRHVLSLSLSGATRQAIHFVISPRGSLAFLLLIPICALLPVIVSLSCVLYSGIEVSPELLAAIGDVLTAAAPAMLKGLVFWLELCLVLVLYLRAHSFAIGSAMTLRRAVGLVCVSQLPALYLSPLFAVGLFILPALSLLIGILAIFQFVILIFIGTEFAAMDKKRGVFASFSIMLGAYICTAAALCAVNFPVAAEYIARLFSFI